MAMALRCRFEMLSMLNAECFQSWLLEAQWELAGYQATGACLDLLLSLIVPGILSLRKLICQGILGRDSQEHAYHLADGHH